MKNLKETYYAYELEGEQTIVSKEGAKIWPFLWEVASIIAMDDITEQHITKIVFEGTEYYYAGWEPGMAFTFINKNDPDDTYTTRMEHLEH